MKQIFINSGQFHVATEHTQIATVLGSCVAICLYDSKTNICGLNHYLLALWNGNGLKSPKYGNISTELMIENMLKVGAKKESIVAKIFGGANINNLNITNSVIGEKNILVANRILEEHKIPIIAKDVGGNRGRKLAVDSISGKIRMKYV